MYVSDRNEPSGRVSGPSRATSETSEYALTLTAAIARSTRLEQGFLDLGTVGERMDHDVERPVAEILHQPLGEPGDREIAHVLVALVGANLVRGIRQRVERGIERIDLLELQERTVRQAARLVDLAALEQVQED